MPELAAKPGAIAQYASYFPDDNDRAARAILPAIPRRLAKSSGLNGGEAVGGKPSVASVLSTGTFFSSEFVIELGGKGSPPPLWLGPEPPAGRGESPVGAERDKHRRSP